MLDIDQAIESVLYGLAGRVRGKARGSFGGGTALALREDLRGGLLVGAASGEPHAIAGRVAVPGVPREIDGAAGARLSTVEVTGHGDCSCETGASTVALPMNSFKSFARTRGIRSLIQTIGNRCITRRAWVTEIESEAATC